MRIKIYYPFKDQKFYNIISDSFGFKVLELNISVRNLCRAVSLSFKGLTTLLLINYFVQFFFIRIYRATENNKTVAFGILYFVMPLTGWSTKYKILNKSNNLKFKQIYKCK